MSKQRVSQLMAAWRTGGWQALEPKSTRPKSNPNATAPAVVERILALRQELIDYGTSEILRELTWTPTRTANPEACDQG